MLNLNKLYVSKCHVSKKWYTFKLLILLVKVGIQESLKYKIEV